MLTRKDGMTAEQPRVSPDGTRVVYDRGDILGAGPGIALFVADLEGGPERQVTDWTTMAAHPDWVSDDRLIFNSYDLGFFQDTEEASNLYSVAADGSDLQQLTAFGRSDTRAHPATDDAGWVGESCSRASMAKATGREREPSSTWMGPTSAG